jgi:site-specific recombinase XerD
MLEHFFADLEVAGRLRRGPLGPYLDSYAAAIDALGYARSTTREQLWSLAELGRWLERQEGAAADLDERVVETFLTARRRRRRRLRRSDAATYRRFLDHLRKEGVVSPTESRCEESALDRLTRCYEAHLKRERGLERATVDGYRPFVRRFLVERFRDEPLRLETLAPSDISSFVLRHARSMSPKRAQLMTSALRSFFRFLLQQGEIATDLAACVPAVADWRLSTVPKYLGAEEVERLLSACDQRTGIGRRDYAILMLLARLGLRASEVVALELDDIDWRAGEIVVRGKGQQHDRMPLLQEVGEALATYLRRDRPCASTRRVFVRVRAPLRSFASRQAISTIVRRALQRADLRAPVKGVAAHLLRHSLATAMLRRGASMAEIGEVLRHRAPSTTEIYAKVDIGGLRSLAQPWPGSGGGR